MSGDTARILLWGLAGAGKTTTLERVHAKLQPHLRGEIRREPTAIDPTVHFEAMPISLGEVGGLESQLEIIAVPGAPEQAITRKQLLDEVDGIILVLDCSPERIADNDEAVAELRQALADYGRSLDDVPIVLQYNKRDVADPFAIEDFHRRIGLHQAAVFETIATTGHGILATLTTISKHVVRARKGQSGTQKTQAMKAAPEVVEDPNASSSDVLEAAILAEAEMLETDPTVEDAVELEFTAPGAQPDWNAATRPDPDRKPAGALRIVSAGASRVDADGALRLPLVLGDESGQTHSVVLSLRLDALLDGGD